MPKTEQVKLIQFVRNFGDNREKNLKFFKFNVFWALRRHKNERNCLNIYDSSPFSREKSDLVTPF